jgi:hypothetical protein
LGYKASEVVGKIAPAQLRDEGDIIRHTQDLSIEIGQEVRTYHDGFCNTQENGPIIEKMGVL